MHKNRFKIFYKNYIIFIFLISFFIFLVYKILFFCINNKYSKIEFLNKNFFCYDFLNKIVKNNFFSNTKNKNNKKEIIKYNLYVYLKQNNINNILLNQCDEKCINKLIKIDKALINFKNSQKKYWVFNNKKILKYLIWKFSNNEFRIYKKYKNDFYYLKILFQKHFLNKIYFGTLKSKKNFFYIAEKIGLNKKEIILMGKLLKWKINLNKLGKDDKFSIAISYNISNSSLKNKKTLLGIRIYSKGNNFYAIRAKNGKFYDQYGKTLNYNFMRFPTKKKYRISSNFNFYRLNPITGYIKPHKGIDLALPIGTPVLGVADGKVIVSKDSNLAGKYITIKHNNNYLTRYMHLKKVFVQIGQNIKMGEKIALSGNSGRSTGPHLHYEMWINNKAVNPLNIKLPYYEDNLKGKNKIQYLRQVQKIIPLLNF